MSTLHIITIKPAWYRDSSELSLAFRLFTQNFPKDNTLDFIFIETDKLSDEVSSDKELDSKIHKALINLKLTASNDDELIFLVRQPALLLNAEVIIRMITLLKNKDIDCVIPASYPDDYPLAAEQQYFTLQGYQHYVTVHLKPLEKEFVAYDDRPVSLFATRLSVISAMNLTDSFFHLPELLSKRTVISLGAYIHPFFDYFNGANEDMIELIPATAKSLMDIGCSSGEFGQAVKKQRQIPVAGIEINTTAANIAKSKIDQVYVGNALNISTDQLFDCVTCLDVLEHFSSPDALLKRIASEFLKAQGVLLLNLPNIGHWSIVEDLLNGHWDYLPGGTLCNTHVRFFTRHTIIDLLENNGFTVDNIIAVKTELPQKTEAYLALIEKQGKQIDRENLETVSFRVVAKKQTG